MKQRTVGFAVLCWLVLLASCAHRRTDEAQDSPPEGSPAPPTAPTEKAKTVSTETQEQPKSGMKSAETVAVGRARKGQDKAGQPATGSAGTLTEEYAVYDAVLESDVIHGAKKTNLFVIREKTCVVPCGSFEAEDLSGVLRRENRELDPGLVEDFLTKNGEQHRLERRFGIRTNYILMSEEEEERLREAPESEDPYAKYRNPVGKIWLSRVGFDSRGHQGLVHISTIRGVLWASGFLVLLEKRRGTWTVVWEAMTWIS